MLSTISAVSILVGVVLGIALGHLRSAREKKAEAEKRAKVLRKVWSFLGDNFYEPIVFEMAKEVSETGKFNGPNRKRWGDAFGVLKELGFTKDSRVKDRMAGIHSSKATKFMINIKWPDGFDMPYIGTRAWSILYLDEKKNQIVRLYSKCQADALSVFPLHQLLKAKEIQIHNPDGDLTDYLTVEQTENEVVVSRLDGTEVGRYEKPKEEAVTVAEA